MKVIKTAKYLGLTKSASTESLNINIPADLDPNEPVVRVMFDYSSEKGYAQTHDSPAYPGSTELIIRRVVAIEDTRYGKSGSDITAIVDQDPALSGAIESIVSGILEEKDTDLHNRDKADYLGI